MYAFLKYRKLSLFLVFVGICCTFILCCWKLSIWYWMYNEYVGMSQPSVSRCVRHVNAVLNNPHVFNEWIHFPSNLDEFTAIRNAYVLTENVIKLLTIPNYIIFIDLL